MRTRTIILALLTSFVFHGNHSLGAAEADNHIVQRRFTNTYRPLFANRSRLGGRTLGAQSEPLRQFVDKLVAALNNGEALAKATKEVTKNAKVVYVPLAEFNAKVKEKPDTLFVTIEANAGSDDQTIWLSYMLKFGRPIDTEWAQQISDRYNELVSPELKTLSQQLFTERYEPALAETNKAKDSATDKVNQLETERRSLQLRSYEELPYEKVADHLADLQRQQLTLKLSLVGMDAKKNEIEKQLQIAHVKIAEKKANAEHEATSSEVADTLKKLVELKSKYVGSLMDAQKKVPGSVATSDIDEANARVLEAKLQLLTAISKKAPSAGNEQLEILQAELTRLAIDRSEQQARLEYLEKMREEAQDRIARRANIDQDIKRIDEQLPASKRALQTADTRVKELEDAKAAFRPIDLTKTEN